MQSRLAQGVAIGLVLAANVACSQRVTVNHAHAHAAPTAHVHEDSSAGIHQPTATQRALGIYQSYSDADINFLAGMIPHHAQAVIMSGWAPTHGARRDLAILCERILVGQADEIVWMQEWLRDRDQPVPDGKSTRMRMKMNGMEHDMLMPGMLSDEEMAELDKARGAEFDRLFLLGMMKHLSLI